MWMTQTLHDIRIFNVYRLNNHTYTYRNRHRIINIQFIYIGSLRSFPHLGRCHLICDIMVGQILAKALLTVARNIQETILSNINVIKLIEPTEQMFRRKPHIALTIVRAYFR